MRRGVLLVLIASVLVLCVVTSQAKEKVPGHTIKTDSQSNQHHNPSNEPSPSIEQKKSSNLDHESDNNKRQTDEALKLNRLLTLYTGQLAVYTWRLVLIGFLQIAVTAFQAFLLIRSFRIAQLALRTDRPYLLVERGNLDGVVYDETTPNEINGELRKFPDFFPRTFFNFRNYGKSPALIHDAVILMTVVKALPPARDFEGSTPIHIHLPAIAAGEPWNPPAYFGPVGIDFADHLNAISERAEQLIAYGRVRYEDVLGNPYETGFCWIYYPPRYVEVADSLSNIKMVIGKNMLFPGGFLRGPKTHNYSE